MTDLTREERHVIAHALGLTPRGGSRKAGRRWAYRNWFGAGGKDVDTWRGLVERGFACTLQPTDPANKTPGFAVTHAGAVAAGLRDYVPSSLIAKER